MYRRHPFPGEPAIAYGEIRRVLKPGCRAVLTCREPLDRHERLSSGAPGKPAPARAGRRGQPSVTFSVTLCQVYSRVTFLPQRAGIHLSLARCLNEKANEACQCSREDGHKDVGARAGLSIRDSVDDSTQGDY